MMIVFTKKMLSLIKSIVTLLKSYECLARRLRSSSVASYDLDESCFLAQERGFKRTKQEKLSTNLFKKRQLRLDLRRSNR